jgi:ribosomal protein S5
MMLWETLVACMLTTFNRRFWCYAGGAVRIVLEVAGVKNVIAKQLGSNNLLNNARACALENLTTKSQVAKAKFNLKGK